MADKELPAPRTPQAPVDTNVPVPRGVREAAARAQAAFDAAKAAAEPPQETPQNTAQDPPQDPTITPEVTPPADPPATPPEPPPPPENFEHKYNSMKGRFERSQEQIRTLSEQMKALQNLLATAPAPAVSTPTDKPPPQNLITEQERNDYGDEFLTVVAKRAREEVGTELAELRNTIQQLKSQATLSARDKLENALTEAVPNWNEINHSDEFKAWLALPDPFSGDIRHTTLTRVYERNLIPQTIAFFKGFLAEEAALGPAVTTNKPDQNTGNNPGKIPLESLAAPGRAKTAAPSPMGPTEKPIIARSDIAKFYAAVNSGQYRGRDEDRARDEAEIFAAQREGRIR